MIDTCRRIAKTYPSLTLGIAGVCLIISPLPLSMNMKALDNFVTDGFYPYFRLAGWIVLVLCCVANLAGISLIGFAVIMRMRRVKSGLSTGSFKTPNTD